MKQPYHTEQREAVLAFLRSAPDRQFTVEEIVAALAGEHSPGKSTVYRLMTRFAEEGTVRRSVLGNSRHFGYQIVPEHCDSHFHLKCTDCGRLIHLDESISDAVQGEILTRFRFAVDERKTVLLGQCEACVKDAAPSTKGTHHG